MKELILVHIWNGATAGHGANLPSCPACYKKTSRQWESERTHLLRLHRVEQSDAASGVLESPHHCVFCKQEGRLSKLMLDSTRKTAVANIRFYALTQAVIKKARKCKPPASIQWLQIDENKDKWGQTEGWKIYHLGEDGVCRRFPYDYEASMSLYLLQRFDPTNLSKGDPLP